MFDAPQKKSSGVSIGGGLVATCAHINEPPGTKVMVQLSDGRNSRAEIVSTNRISDIGIVKLEDGQGWPSAEMGDSRNLVIGEGTVFAGYPVKHEGDEPVLISALRRNEWVK
jgi:S1-C subfamily serine protease